MHSIDLKLPLWVWRPDATWMDLILLAVIAFAFALVLGLIVWLAMATAREWLKKWLR